MPKSQPRPVYDNSLPFRITNVSTASISEMVVCPFAGRMTELHGVYSAGITGSNNTLTILKNGASAATCSPVSTGTAAGSVFVENFRVSVNRGDTLAVQTDGASTNTSVLNMQAVITGLTA